MPDLFTTIASIPALVGGGAPGGGSVGFPCPAGGSGSVSCRREPPEIGPPDYELSFSACAISTSGGRVQSFDGRIAAAGDAGDACGQNSSALEFSIPTLVLSSSGETTTTATITALQGSLSITDRSPSCGASAFAAEIEGSIASRSEVDGVETSAAEATFANTAFLLEVTSFGPLCSIGASTMSVDGEISYMVGDTELTATYDAFELTSSAADDGRSVVIAGEVASTCPEAMLVLATRVPLDVPSGADCPSAGEITVSAGAGFDAITWGEAGTFVDVGDDGTVDAAATSCRAIGLFACQLP